MITELLATQLTQKQIKGNNYQSMLTRIVKTILQPSALEEEDLHDLNYIARCPKEPLGSNPNRVAAVKKALVKAKQSQTVMEDDFV